MLTTAPLTQTGRQRPVCVITQDTDIAADRLMLHLTELGTPVLRFDLADFPEHASLEATVARGRGWTGTLTVRGRTIALEEIGAILWWHPGRSRITTSGLSAAEAQWLSTESAAGIVGVLAGLDCLHVNSPAATMAAQLKGSVLARAVACGLDVPATWIGNSLAAAVRFAEQRSMVCKALTVPAIDHADGSSSSLHTTPVTASALGPSLALGAHQFQEAITKQFEVRLIVVGAELLAARIDAHSDAARIDFRRDYGALTYAHVTVPDPVREGVLALMAHYGLSYAASDLLVDDDDRWWLVDLNPAGQYDWLQHVLPDLGISASLARLLTYGGHHAR
ncbi:MvdC/MvdD family ATP grasp protein [Streptomyces sp. NRRL F-5053]|uniref:MvdC/MvdD family ATP grasp protein n=1 Tax=Streptomyces sp. NRRL F-5053 TaxID=1463854 RepID=UPI00068FCBC0|nr:hypothetical protein [Streptomyces sp. NRRL F-5053]